jgi:thiol-disulfide isomerase/thioredoxin
MAMGMILVMVREAWLAWLCLGLLLLVTISSSAKEQKAELSVRSMDGQRQKLSDYRGKIVVLNFWATWCTSCKVEMSMLVQADAEYADKGIAFVAVSVDDAKTSAQIPAFIERYGVRFPVLRGTYADVGKLQMGPVLPATAFLDQEGYIVSRIYGQMQEGEIQQRLNWMLGDKKGISPPPLVKHMANN